MQWTDVVKPPSARTLRQFAGLCLVVFPALALWRTWGGQFDTLAVILVVAGVAIGGLGLIHPPAIRWVFTSWMVVAFPIGWLVSRVALGILFYGIVTPIALVFRLAGRDALHRRRQSSRSFWTEKARPRDVREYFRQF